MRTILFAILLLLLGISESYASGGSQPLGQAVKKATLVVKAKVSEAKKRSGKWGHLHIKAEKIEAIKGNLKDKSLFLNFRAHVYANEVDDKKYGKVRKWYTVPQSGKELKMKKGEVWFFFFHSTTKDSKGYISVFRAEPADQEKKIKDLLKAKGKKTK